MMYSDSTSGLFKVNIQYLACEMLYGLYVIVFLGYGYGDAEAG